MADFTARYDFFFDRPHVQAILTRAERRYLMRVGGYARQAARGAIRRVGTARRPPARVGGKAHQRWIQEVQTKPSSTPPKPPHTHTGWYKTIWVFALDPGRGSVVIGAGTTRAGKILARHELAQAVPLDVYESIRSGRKILRETTPRASRFRPTGERVVARYPQRSALTPASERTQPKMAQFYAEALAAA